MFSKAVLACILLCGFVSCTSSDEYSMVWNEEFEYEGLPDSSKWNFDTKGNTWGWGNDESQFYTHKKSENAYVKDGVLKITALNEKHKEWNYTSARLTSKGKGDWLYGRFVIRAKVPGGRGTWPAIWMLPTDGKYGGWPKSGEIDIMEYVGYDPDIVHFTVHTESFNHKIKTQIGKVDTIKNFEDDFHLFRLDWEPEVCRFYVDDMLKFTFEKTSDIKAEWPFDQRFHILLNLAIGGWGGVQGIDDSIFPVAMEVDYVRVFQKKQ